MLKLYLLRNYKHENDSFESKLFLILLFAINVMNKKPTEYGLRCYYLCVIIKIAFSV